MKNSMLKVRCALRLAGTSLHKLAVLSLSGLLLCCPMLTPLHAESGSHGNRFDRSFSGRISLARYQAAPPTECDRIDPTFDADGKVITNFPGRTSRASATAIQSDGKIIVAGHAFSAVGSGFVSDFAVARYNADGSLDTSFNGSGMVTAQFPGAQVVDAQGRVEEVAIQSDGKIVVAGWSSLDIFTPPEFLLARFGVNGLLDNGFGSSGKVTTDFSSGFDVVNDLAIQSDGKVVVVGSTFTIAAGSDFALARYDVNGSLDSSFDTDGKIITDFFGRNNIAWAIAIQNNGKVVVAGTALNASGNPDFALARYDINGSLDIGFGTDGKTMTDFSGSNDGALALAIQNDAKIVVAGQNGVPFSDIELALARYTTSGQLDTGFCAGGKLTTSISPSSVNDTANAVAVQSDGKIVAAGFTFSQTSGVDFTLDFALVRYFGGEVSVAPVGSNVTVQAGPAAVTFTSVSAPGIVSVAQINPNSAGQLPGGFEVGGSLAFEITTTATVTGPITVCFNVASVNDEAVFNSLRILHSEGGMLIDRTILPPDSPSPDFATRTICARVGSLSPFVIARGRSAAAKLDELIALVRSFNLQRGIENSLDAKLQNAQNALDAVRSGNNTSACNLMSSFINEVQAQTGGAVTQAQATQLIAAANQIKATLGCPR
jgi:uncharacterized delta-60 repeat protein